MMMAYGPPRPTAHDELIFKGPLSHTISDSRLKEDWEDFRPPGQLPINHPWLSRHCPSVLTYFDNGSAGSNTVSTEMREVYGNEEDAVAFRIGCGSAGYTGIFKALSERYIATHGGDFAIGMVRNISRHTQVALLADIVQIAFTQEPHNDDLAIAEGWCERACRVFNDHFILVGPTANPAGISIGASMAEALQTMTACGIPQVNNRRLFHSNGDGSSTFFKKQKLWLSAGIDLSNAKWAKAYGMSPYSALKNAAKDCAYILTDRATYLTAKHHGLIPRMRVFVEGGLDLMNPCSALLNTMTSSERNEAAAQFADWLSSDDAQEIIRQYGRDWSYGKSLFTTAHQDEFEESARLAGRI